MKDGRFMPNKYHVRAVLFIALIAAVCVALNLFTSLLSTVTDTSFDMSSEQMLKIGDETRGYLDTVNDDITIYVVSAKHNFDTFVGKFLDNYQRACSKITVNYVDVNFTPGFAARYVPDGQLSANSIIVESKKRFKIIPYADLYVYSPTAQTVVGFCGDEKLTSAVLYTLSDSFPVISVLEGHDETLDSAFAALITDNNISLEKVNLAVKDPSPESRAIMISKPVVDFSAEEIGKLNSYLDTGKSLVVFLDPACPELTAFYEFLSFWGIRADDNVILDAKYCIGNNPANILAVPGDNDFNRMFNDSSQILVVPFARALTPVFTEKDSRKVVSYLMSSGESYAKSSDAQGTLAFDAKADKKGPFVILTVTTKTTYKDGETLVSNVLVSGSAGMVGSTYLNTPGVLNGGYIMALIQKTIGETDTFTVMPRYYKVAILKLNTSAANMLSWFFTLIVPLGFIIAGGVILRKRRNR